MGVETGSTLRVDRPLYVYVAGPYSVGDLIANVQSAMRAGNALMARGHVPFVPHLNHFWDAYTFKDYETWLAWCLNWVQRCDMVLRIPGVSAGADREVELAQQLHIPVVFSVDEVPMVSNSCEARRGDTWDGREASTRGTSTSG